MSPTNITISLDQVSKRFQRYWIFKDISCTFEAGKAWCLLGANGSGKSTLMRVIAGMQNPSKGKVHYQAGDKQLTTSEVFKDISFCAPGMEIVEELTLREFLDFHFSFKRLLPGLSVTDVIEITGLKAAADKPIGDYSSGMKQRVKLAQAIFADTPILLLDEPCTNLDQAGMEQYRDWIEKYATSRLVIVASNDVREYFFCREQIVLEDYK